SMHSSAIKSSPITALPAVRCPPAIHLDGHPRPRHLWTVIRGPAGAFVGHPHLSLRNDKGGTGVQARLLCDTPAGGCHVRLDAVTDLEGPLTLEPTQVPDVDPVTVEKIGPRITLANSHLRIVINPATPARAIQLQHAGVNRTPDAG